MRAFNNEIIVYKGCPGGSDGKESAFNAGDQVQSLGWEDPWRREWLPTPVFLPGEFHGQTSLGGVQSMGSQKSRTRLSN